MQFLHWRVLLRFGTIPSLLLFLLSTWVPFKARWSQGASYLNESPMFLALKGHNKEACSVVESMGRPGMRECKH